MRAGPGFAVSTDEKIRAWVLAAEWIEAAAKEALEAERARSSPRLDEERAIRHALAVVAPATLNMARRIARNRKR